MRRAAGPVWQRAIDTPPTFSLLSTQPEEVLRMRWVVLICLLCLAFAPVAHAQSTTYYFCTFSPVSGATIYFSGLFGVPEGIDVSRIENGYALFLVERYKESVSSKTQCKPQIDIIQGGRVRDLDIANYRQLRWRVIDTFWSY